MSDIMQPIEFKKLLNWIIEEYKNEKTIFGIHEDKFYRKPDDSSFTIFNEKCETALGPAAGPHTQQAPNIVAAYLTGGRFFELKTVQIMDTLDIEKPCIEATDEGYNTEWSTELTVQQAYEEYIKAWFLLHLLNKMFGLSKAGECSFIFNMSVGYDLKGIKNPKIDNFIEELKDASGNEVFQQYKADLKKAIESGKIPNFTDVEFVETISPNISNSITLSTMHGCPPEDQELICKYLIGEKKLHTFLKMNPTLHGYEYVKKAFRKLGYDHIILKEESFTNDMQYSDAVRMLKVLLAFADENNVEFGVKLSNTLAVVNEKGILPTDEMYMSGRALFPLTINLAKKLSYEFDGNLKISYAGGASWFNVDEIYNIGIRPITIATDLLKPGGYTRFKQMAELLDVSLAKPALNKIDLDRLDKLAEEALEGPTYRMEAKSQEPMFIDKKLGMFDCFIAPCQFRCPINQDVPEYIHLINSGKYRQALEVILTKNPLPHITGHICDHTCMLKCVRNDYEEPLLIRDLKRIAVEKGFEHYQQEQKKFSDYNGPEVAVIGAGPTGLSAGYFLANKGFKVTIFDNNDNPGGMVKFGIPHFRLPRTAIDNDIMIVKNSGVRFELNTDPNFDIMKLKKKGFKYIIIAIGAWKSKQLTLNNNKGNIRNAVQFLLDFNKAQDQQKLGSSVVVVGGGNSAMDSARAALRVSGVKNVSIIYRRTVREMPADKEELENAFKDGIQFKELLNPVSLIDGILKCQKMKLGEPDSSGRKRPLPIADEFEDVPADTLLSAIGETVDTNILKVNKIAPENIAADSDVNYETGLDNVFIGGDALRGPSTVVEAIADGRNIADAILEKEGIDPDKVELENYQFDDEKRIKEITLKKGNIVVGFDLNQQSSSLAIETESSRCLECHLLCNKCVEVCPNRANVAVKIPGFRDYNQILHLDYLCNECGNCETFCPYQGAPYKDKFTLFLNEKDMMVNGNNGFLLISEKDTIEFKVRVNDKFFMINFDKSGKLLNSKSDHGIKKKSEFDALINMIWWTYENQKFLFV